MGFQRAAMLALLVFVSGCATAPGARHPDRPNVIRGADGNAWTAAPGYAWIYPNDNSDLSVRWEPGKRYVHPIEEWPNVYASETEGRWYPASGYTWTHKDSAGRPIPGDLAVKWNPGAGYWYFGKIVWPSIHASDTERDWVADEGYEWVNANAKDDLAVISIAERKAAQQRENEMEEHWAKYLREIQTQNTYPNWSGPPYESYLRSRKR